MKMLMKPNLALKKIPKQLILNLFWTHVPTFFVVLAFYMVEFGEVVNDKVVPLLITF